MKYLLSNKIMSITIKHNKVGIDFLLFTLIFKCQEFLSSCKKGKSLRKKYIGANF